MPILILSESASTQEWVAALNHGADDFLAKPYEPDEYLAKAQALLRRYRELNHIAERGYAFVSNDKLLLDTARRTVLVEARKSRFKCGISTIASSCDILKCVFS